MTPGENAKYHGWRYGLAGDLTFVQQESEFFDLDKAAYGLVPVQVDTWEGFIFVNLDKEKAAPAGEYLGQIGSGLEGYPFHLMTQVHTYRAEVGSNWKLFIDAFADFYHAPILHAKQAVADESRKLSGYGFEALSYQLDGPQRHGLVVGRHVPAQGREHGQADRAGAAQRPVRPVGPPRHRPGHRRAAAGHQPGPAPGLGRRLVRSWRR